MAQDNGWRLIDNEPIPNTVFDVIAKYYDPVMDRFLMQRFANCVQVEGVVFWSSPFEKPIRLTDHGYRPTHWMLLPEAPEWP